MSDTHWHGFSRVWDFAKAALSIGAVVAAMVSAVVAYAVDNLDERFAPITIVATVESSAKVVQEIQLTLVSIQANNLENQIFEAMVRQCDSQSAEARQFFSRQIAGMSKQYKKLEGTNPFIPRCEDLS